MVGKYDISLILTVLFVVEGPPQQQPIHIPIWHIILKPISINTVLHIYLHQGIPIRMHLPRVPLQLSGNLHINIGRDGLWVYSSRVCVKNL